MENQKLLDIIDIKNIKIQNLEYIINEQHSNINSNSFTNNSNNHILLNNNDQVTIQTPISESNQTNFENIVDSEYICLICNQFFTSKDIFNHSQINKDHFEHCIQIDKIKDQLVDINNNNNNNENNNIFRKRIETLWSSLKKLSTTHSSLNSKINEITNHFKIYYDFLMSKEHSLKKQMQDDIDLINNDINHQLNEFKSILNIVNINNSINNNNNSSDDSILENTNYNKSFSIIESIRQSESYNSFIENNKNTILYNNNIIKENNINNCSEFVFSLYNHNRNFNSGVLNPTEVKLQSKIINENLYKVKVKHPDIVCFQLKRQIEELIKINENSSAVVIYGDLERIKQYFNSNKINKLEYNYHNRRSKQQIKIKKIIIEMLKSNRIDILKYLFQELHFDLTTKFKPDLQLIKTIEKVDLLAMSTIYSNLDTIQFIESLGINQNIKWKYDICLELSPFSNNIKILQYFSTKVNGMISPYFINHLFVSGNASLLGHIDMIKWISKYTTFLFKYFNPGVIYCMDVAALNGHLETIKWLHENRTEGCTAKAMNNAAENGHIETIKWLHYIRTEGCTADAMNYAAENGHLETIIWLHFNRTEGCTTWAMDKAASYGYLETVKWLHYNRGEGCTTVAMDGAAKNGHLETIKWLHFNRTEGCTAKAMDNAAINGHLETIKWLHENRSEGCTANTMDYAAEYGHLETIKWLHVNRTEGCTTWAMDNAAKNGHLGTIIWLHCSRTEGCTTKALNEAARYGHLETIKWLHQYRTEGCTTMAMDNSAIYGHIETIKWLHHYRREGCTAAAMYSAASHGHLEIVKWLYENRTECCVAEAMKKSKENNHLDVYEWLQCKSLYNQKKTWS